MMRVTYANESFLTSTAIARSLLSYSAALARLSTADTVTIPTLNRDGAQVEMHFVVGPASQLSAVVEESTFDEPESIDELARMDDIASRAFPPPGRRDVSIVRPADSTRFESDMEFLDGL